MATKKEIEARLSLKQREAALMLVENELSDTATKKTQEEIAEALGLTRMGLYKWRQQKDFIDYKNMIADEFFAEFRPTVYKQLLRLINSPQPSVKAIDLYMRKHAMLTDKTIVEDGSTGAGGRTNEQLEKELGDLDALLED